ncbi:flavodoxin family protein [candidate division KSB1 bacterium]
MTEGKNRARVLGIVGSPRKGGNTEILVNEVLAGAEAEGANVEKIMLSKLNISPCLACDACRRTGKCVQNDDFEEILGKMMKSDVWVLATPVYWWGPTAQFKTFLDRWYGYYHKYKFKSKRAIVVVAFESEKEETSRHVTGMFKDVFNYIGMELIEEITAPGVLDRGDINKHPEILAEAFRAGRDAVKS